MVMEKRPFKETLKGPWLELRIPKATLGHAQEMLVLLERNDWFYPRRLTLRNYRTAEDCLALLDRRVQAINAMTDIYYDIYARGEYIGEIYARDIDYDFNAAKNIGYFIDKEFQNRGYASEAVSTLEEELFEMGVHRVCLFVHFFSEDELNLASEGVAKKCGYKFEGTARDAIYDKFSGRYASEHMFSKLSTERGKPRS